MWHQTEDVAFAITDASNIIPRTIWISRVCYVSVFAAVAKDDALFPLEFLKRAVVANVVSLGMCNGNATDCATLEFICKWTVGSLDPHKNVFTNEMQITIAY